jgi:hypothetical protein
LVEDDELLVVKDDVWEGDFEAFETFNEEEVVDNFEEAEGVEEKLLVKADVEDASLVEDDGEVFDDTSTHNATRKSIKNFENMMKM